jgi:hypothetical protein
LRSLSPYKPCRARVLAAAATPVQLSHNLPVSFTAPSQSPPRLGDVGGEIPLQDLGVSSMKRFAFVLLIGAIAFSITRRGAGCRRVTSPERKGYL